MHPYRTHTCAALRKEQVGETVKLSGWIHRKRDHGGVLFIDLRDTHGVTQCVVDEGSPLLAETEKLRSESVITVVGKVRERPGETQNPKMPTGEIELYIDELTVQGASEVIPFQVAEDDGAGEELRLKYRYLDLRREKMQKNIRLRNDVIFEMRKRMYAQDFQEFQTPILTASSPEGARDYLVPSRLHAGKFYALPQAPQQFKQMLMVSGFDKYFQIAPCFRDEDGRADRLAEFYQLDLEMSFVTQEDVFNTVQPVIEGIFEQFNDFTGTPHKVEWLPHLRYEDAMLKYGSDKPDLRNPLEIVDVTGVFARDDVTFDLFKNKVGKGEVVRAIRVPKASGLSKRGFFKKLDSWAQGEGSGLAFLKVGICPAEDNAGNATGFEEGISSAEMVDNNIVIAAHDGIAKFLSVDAVNVLTQKTQAQDGDAVFFICNKELPAAKFAGAARDAICNALPEGHEAAREKGVFKFCWIIDFPMYERDEQTGEVDFSHNPFSMPQGGMDDLENKDPEQVYAYQYDAVCNGFELCSGAIRNHKAEIMEKAFGIAGYDKSVLEDKFGGMLNAFQYGAPPHGGCAFGVDRIIMLLADEPNLREVYAFVMNGQYEDQMMSAPNDITPEQLKDLHIKLDLPKAKKEQAA